MGSNLFRQRPRRLPGVCRTRGVRPCGGRPRGRLRRHGELLELLADDGEFFVYNVTDVIGALDEAASVGPRLAPGRFGWIYKHVFVPAQVEGQEIFKLPQLRYGPVVYVTDRFCERVEAAGLRGFAPVEVWSERDGPRWYEGL